MYMRRSAFALLLMLFCGCHKRIAMTGGVPRDQFVPTYYAERESAPDRNGNFGVGNYGTFDARAYRYGGIYESRGYGRSNRGYRGGFAHR